MALVVLGIDALDPALVSPERHPYLALDAYRSIDTITSAAGAPSTHELWPTIITGLSPEEHGLQLQDGVSWDNPVLSVGSRVAGYLLPGGVRSAIGTWLLDNTEQDAFRTPATYYGENGLSTVFDAYESLAIGVPNYVVETDAEDRENQLRRRLGDLFERDDEAVGGHTSSDPVAFYERCLEMSMIRIARVRRALRGRRYELVIGYTSGLDLIGHVTNDLPDLQRRAYDELNDFVGELVGDLDEGDELLLVSDHGLQDGVHTHEAMVAGTEETMVERIESVTDVRASLEAELDSTDHQPTDERSWEDIANSREVQDQLEELGYL